MDEKISPADEYEERIRNLLKKLGFTKVKGGNNFIIGENQIDACGVCEDKLLIIECTTQRQTIRSKIETWKGKLSSIRKGLDSLGDYREYNKSSSLRFILASKYSAVNQYEEMAKEGNNKVFLWGPNSVYYYERLAKAIPFRAQYDVLADLGLEMSGDETLSIPAFRVVSNNIEMYNFFVAPDDLIKISYVARREAGKKDFYQRMIDPSRLTKISEFLESGGVFPTNIVIGINEEFKFKKAVFNGFGQFPDWLSFGILTFPKSYQSCWIIDGQHRLFSFKKGMCQKLPVLAFGNIDLNKQTRFFLEVNKEAKPISSTLIWDLVGDLSPQSEDGIISNAVKITNTVLPFKGKISIPSVGSGKIHLATFCDSLMKSDFGSRDIKTGKGKLFVKNPFQDNNPNTFSKNIARSTSLFFEEIDNLINDKDYVRDFVFDNGGLSVLIYLYKIIICMEGKQANKNIVINYLSPIINHLSSLGKDGVGNYKKMCSSEGGKKLVVNDLLKLLVDVNPDICDYIEEKTDLFDELVDLETKLRKVAEIEFRRKNFKEIKSHINQSVIKQVEESIKRKTQDDVGDFCNQLTLGQLSDIITRELWKGIFKNVFVRPESDKAAINEPRFPNEEYFRVNLAIAVKTRNRLAHEKGYTLTIKDKELLLSFINQIKGLISFYYKI